MPSIFLCHSSKDKFFVRELASQLASAGVKVWLDEAEIRIGDSLTDRIGKAVSESDFFGIILSRHSVTSEWVQRELRIALDRELKSEKVVVIPILLEDVTLPPFLRDKLYADFTSSERSSATFPKLLAALGAKAPTSPTNPPARPSPRVAQSASERRLLEFQDVVIADLDVDKSYNPDQNFALYNMYLRLSHSPPYEWQQIFDAERRFPRHTMWRRAWVEGDYIVVHCVPDELERFHMRDLVDDVAQCNTKYRAYLLELTQQESRVSQVESRRREELRQLRKKLGFD